MFALAELTWRFPGEFVRSRRLGSGKSTMMGFRMLDRRRWEYILTMTCHQFGDTELAKIRIVPSDLFFRRSISSRTSAARMLRFLILLRKIDDHLALKPYVWSMADRQVIPVELRREGSARRLPDDCQFSELIWRRTDRNSTRTRRSIMMIFHQLIRAGRR